MAAKPTAPKTPRPPAKPRQTPPRVAKPNAVAAQAPVAVTEDGTDAATKPAAGLRLKDLVDLVVASSGIKKKDVRTVVEAALSEMGAALQKGESLNLVGLGKMRVVKAAAEAGGAMTLKLRVGLPGEKAGKAGADPLADAEDQD